MGLLNLLVLGILRGVAKKHALGRTLFMQNIKTTQNSRIFDMARVSLMCAILCILSPISIPIGPIPVSLSLFAVYLTCFLLDTKKSLCAVSLYILIGFVGLPVFSGYAGGAAKLFGPTGGYIFGYLLIALISGIFMEHFPQDKWAFRITGCILGLIICYALGTAWFMLLSKTAFNEALALCVLPFVPFDLLKIAMAYFLSLSILRSIAFISTR